MNRKQTTEDRRRYEVLSQLLTERQAEIRNKLRSLREVLPAAVTQVKDDEERSMEDFVLGMDFALMEMESETLRRIDEALLRLEEGTYGACSSATRAFRAAQGAALQPLPRLSEQAESWRRRATRPSRFFEDAPQLATLRGGRREDPDPDTLRRAEAPARVPVVPARPRAVDAPVSPRSRAVPDPPARCSRPPRPGGGRVISPLRRRTRDSSPRARYSTA
jgi:RNA polymerase-binding transcription factor DksA